MLSEALQRNAKHEARLSNISAYRVPTVGARRSEIESLASRTPSAALQLRFAQNDTLLMVVTNHERANYHVESEDCKPNR
jgi:hypothetical protein